jgi:hypothetical protein
MTTWQLVFSKVTLISSKVLKSLIRDISWEGLGAGSCESFSFIYLLSSPLATTMWSFRGEAKKRHKWWVVVAVTTD